MPNADELLRERILIILAGDENERNTVKTIIQEIADEIMKWRITHEESTTPMNDYHKGMRNGIEFVRCMIASDEPNYL